MIKEQFERKENEEIKKSINSEAEISDLQERKSSLQEKDSIKEVAENMAEELTKIFYDEDELMEVPDEDEGKILAFLFISIIIIVIVGTAIVIATT